MLKELIRRIGLILSREFFFGFNYIKSIQVSVYFFVCFFGPSILAGTDSKECDSMTLDQLTRDHVYIIGCYEVHPDSDKQRSYFVVLENRTELRENGLRGGLTLTVYRSKADFTIEAPAFKAIEFLAVAGIPFSYETPGNSKMFVVTDFGDDGNLEAAFLGNGKDQRVAHFFVSQIQFKGPSELSIQFYNPETLSWETRPSYFKGLGTGEYILSRNAHQMRLFIPIRKTYVEKDYEETEYMKYYYDATKRVFLNEPIRALSSEDEL